MWLYVDQYREKKSQVTISNGREKQTMRERERERERKRAVFLPHCGLVFLLKEQKERLGIYDYVNPWSVSIV